MIELQIGAHVVQFVDEECYTPGSADNARNYDRDDFVADDEWQSVVGVRCAGQSVALLSPGIRGEVDDRSVRFIGDTVFVVCGSSVFALSVPDLRLRWSSPVDSCSCFGLYLCGDEPFLISHGELEIKRLTLEGRVVWSATGRDIFNGTFHLRDDHVRVEDFNGDAHVVDLATGKTKLLAANRSPESARAWALARCFPTPVWSWVFFGLVFLHVAVHVWLVVSIAVMPTPFPWMLGDPYHPAPQYWHEDLVVDQEIGRGVRVLAVLIWIHITVAAWLWILVGIRSWTAPALPRRVRGVAALSRGDQLGLRALVDKVRRARGSPDRRNP